jgi:hypothetical protein
MRKATNQLEVERCIQGFLIFLKSESVGCFCYASQIYAKDFEEIISVSNDDKQPLELQMNYEDLVKQAKWQKESYKDTTIPK